MCVLSSYKTIEAPVESVLFKEKGSKFIGYLFPVENEDQVKQVLESVKKKYHDARHWCYAYRLGYEGNVYRVNDDGEPGNTAGAPIHGRLLAYEVTNTFLVVVRYFGGVKLGVGGLIKSYRACAQNTLNEAIIVEREIKETFTVVCSYSSMNQVMRIVKSKQLDVVSQTMHLECRLVLSTSVAFVKQVKQAFIGIKDVKLVLKDE